MTTALVIGEAKGKDVSCHFDIITSKLSLRYGETYEDEGAADFFGDAIEVGEPAGFVFVGLGTYTSATDDHVQIGKLVDISFESENFCRLTIVNSQVSGMGSEVIFSFERIERLFG